VAEAIAPPVETETMMIPHRTTPAAAATPAAARARPLAGLLALAALSMAAGCAVLHADDPGRAQAPPAWRVEPVFAIRANSGGESPGRGYFTLGEYYEGAAGWDHAAQAYRQAIALDPGYVEALNALGVLLARTGRADEAEGLLRRAVALAPTRASLHNNLGYLLLQAGRVPEAALELQAAVGADERNEIARSNLRMARARLDGATAGDDATPALATAAAAAAPRPIDARPSLPALADSGAPRMLVGFAPTVGALGRRAVDAAALQATAGDARRAGGVASEASAPAPAAPAARLEICNGNGVPGMAALVGRLLASQGLPASRLANEPPFSRQRTVVQYRTGHADAARRVAGLLPANARLEASLAGAAPSDVRVVLGRDWMAGAACAQRERCTQVSVAMATTGLQ